LRNKERNDEELEELYKELDSLIERYEDKIYEIYSVFRTLLIDYSLEESLITYYDLSRVSEEIFTGDVDILYLKTSAFNDPDKLSNYIDAFCQKGIIYKNLYLVYDQFCQHEDFVNTLINIDFDQKLRLDDFTVQFLKSRSSNPRVSSENSNMKYNILDYNLEQIELFQKIVNGSKIRFLSGNYSQNIFYKNTFIG